MTSLFNGPVFVKPLGVIVNSEQIRYLALSVERSKTFALRSEVTADSMYVDENMVVRIGVSFLLENEISNLAALGAEGYNEYTLDRLENERKLNSETKPVKRGRKAAAEVDDNENEDEISLENLFYAAHHFNFIEVTLRANSTLLEESAPFRAKASISDNNRDVLIGKLEGMRQLRRATDQLRVQLSAPTPDNILESAGNLLLTREDDTLGMPRGGFDTYENGLRKKAESYEASIRATVEFFATKVVEPANEREEDVVYEAFTENIVVGAETLTIDRVIEHLKSEIFVPVSI